MNSQHAFLHRLVTGNKTQLAAQHNGKPKVWRIIKSCRKTGSDICRRKLWLLTWSTLLQGCWQVQGDQWPYLELWKVQKIQREVQDLTAYTAEAHENAMLVVKAHYRALTPSILQNHPTICTQLSRRAQCK